MTASRQKKDGLSVACQTTKAAVQVDGATLRVSEDACEIAPSLISAQVCLNQPRAQGSDATRRDHLVCLSALLGEAAAAAASKRSGSDLADFADRILQIENSAQNSPDCRELEQPIRAMYRRVLDLGQNGLLLKLSVPIEEAIWRDASWRDAVNLEELREAHRLLLNAFATGSPDAARRAVRRGLLAVLAGKEAPENEPDR